MKKDSKLTLIAVGVLAVAYLYLRKKKRDLIDGDVSSFSNASGCSGSDLSDAMSFCEGNALAGETTSVRRCKVRNNGTRRVTCQYDHDNGGVRYQDVTFGGLKRKRRNESSSFSNVGGARGECKDNYNYGLSARDCRKAVRQSGLV